MWPSESPTKITHHVAWTTHQLSSGTVLETATPAWRKGNSPSIHQPLYDSSGEKYGAGGDLFIQVIWWEEPMLSLHNFRIFWLEIIISNDVGRTLRIESSDSDLKEFFGQNGVPWNHLASGSCGAWFYLAFFPEKGPFFCPIEIIFLFIRTFSLRSSSQLVSSWRMWWVPEFWPCPPPWRTSGYFLEALWNLAAPNMWNPEGKSWWVKWCGFFRVKWMGGWAWFWKLQKNWTLAYSFGDGECLELIDAAGFFRCREACWLFWRFVCLKGLHLLLRIATVEDLEASIFVQGLCYSWLPMCTFPLSCGEFGPILADFGGRFFFNGRYTTEWDKTITEVPYSSTLS